MIKMTQKQAAAYKQRWKQVELVQNQELLTTPMSTKFKQLCWLMDSFHSTPDKQREKETEKIRQRWLILKKQWKNGR